MKIDEPLINRAVISRNDFEETLKFIDSFPDGANYTVQEALLIAALIAYARPFSENAEHDLAIGAIPENKITRPLTSEERTLHKQLITIRNKAIAHSDYVKKPTRPAVHKSSLSLQSMPYSILNERLNLQEFRSLTEKMKFICDDIICDEQRKLRSISSTRKLQCDH